MSNNVSELFMWEENISEKQSWGGAMSYSESSNHQMQSNDFNKIRKKLMKVGCDIQICIPSPELNSIMHGI